MARHTARHSTARHSSARPSLARKPSPKGRRFAATILAVVGLAGLSIASAAQLTLGSSTLGAGLTTLATCQGAGTITVGYTTGWNATAPAGHKVSVVTFSGVHADCVGKAYRVQLLNGSSAALGAEITGTVPALVGGVFSTAPIAAGSQQRAQDIGGVALVIVG